MANWKITLTVTAADDDIALLRWIVTRLVRVLDEAPVPVRVRLEREGDAAACA